MAKLARNRRRRNEAILKIPELEEGQSVARVLAARGENIYEVEAADGDISLYSLPKRLRYVAYVKRGSFVFVRNDDTRSTGKLRGDIEVVVLGKFLNHLRRQPFWPSRFASKSASDSSAPAESVEVDPTNAIVVQLESGATGSEQQETKLAIAEDEERKARDEDSDKESDGSDGEWQIGAGNPNRRKWDDLIDEEESSEEE